MSTNGDFSPREEEEEEEMSGTEREMENREPDGEFDTRSEASSSSSADSDTSEPSVSSRSGSDSESEVGEEAESSDGGDDKSEHKGMKRKRSISPIVYEKSSPLRDGEKLLKEIKRSRSESPGAGYKKDTPPRERLGKSPKRSSIRKEYVNNLSYLFRDTRFFLMKSNNAENITISKTKSVWSTPPQNELKLNQAFKECRNVLLIFSVKESGRFSGFARLGTESRRDGPTVNWSLPFGMSARTLGSVFHLDWICRKDLAFTKVQHLYNPWNEGKPVKIGRDGQEIEPRVAEELCRLFPMDDGIEMHPILQKSKRAKSRPTAAPSGPRYRRRERTNSYRDMGPGSSRGPMRGRRRRFRDDDYGPAKRPRGGFLPPYRRDRSPPPRLPRPDSRFLNGYPYLQTGMLQSYTELLRDFQAPPPVPPPMPYAPPPPRFDHVTLPRYYDGPALPEYPHSRSARDKRTYDRSVDEFLRRTNRDRDRDRRYRDRR